jgi:hypothetical protein
MADSVAKQQQPGLTEVGITGLQAFSGQVREEFLPELIGKQGVRVYTEMSSNDALISAMMFAIEMFVRQVKWFFKPQTNSDGDQEAADFLDSALNDMSHTFQQFLSECLSMLPYGWAWFEKVFKKRMGMEVDPSSLFDDGRIAWQKFAIRSQDSLHEWDIDDNGGIQAMVQSAAPDFIPTKLPIDKSLLFRVSTYKNNPEGRSVLRGAYRAWYIKKRIEDVEAIGTERDLAGLPMASMPAEWMGPDATPAQITAVETMKKIVTGVRRDEMEGIAKPVLFDANGNELIKFELLTSGGRRQIDTDKIISRWDQRIAQSLLLDFILIGGNNVGSFALSESKQHFFANAIGAIMDSIADTINRHAVAELIEINGINVDALPVLTHGEVEPPNLRDLGNYIVRMTSAGFNLSSDMAVENHLRRLGSLPLVDPEQRAEEEKRIEELLGTNGGPPPPPGAPPANEVRPGSQHAGTRDPTGLATQNRVNMALATSLSDGLHELDNALDRLGPALGR